MQASRPHTNSTNTSPNYMILVSLDAHFLVEYIYNPTRGEPSTWRIQFSIYVSETLKSLQEPKNALRNPTIGLLLPWLQVIDIYLEMVHTKNQEIWSIGSG